MHSLTYTIALARLFTDPLPFPAVPPKTLFSPNRLSVLVSPSVYSSLDLSPRSVAFSPSFLSLVLSFFYSFAHILLARSLLVLQNVACTPYTSRCPARGEWQRGEDASVKQEEVGTGAWLNL